MTMKVTKASHTSRTVTRLIKTENLGPTEAKAKNPKSRALGGTASACSLLLATSTHSPIHFAVVPVMKITSTTNKSAEYPLIFNALGTLSAPTPTIIFTKLKMVCGTVKTPPSSPGDRGSSKEHVPCQISFAKMFCLDSRNACSRTGRRPQCAHASSGNAPKMGDKDCSKWNDPEPVRTGTAATGFGACCLEAWLMTAAAAVAAAEAEGPRAPRHAHATPLSHVRERAQAR
mmetsp:Transcript_84582/g.237864  ORF Transcript_84582/g.237864 Transcript_84582/m.237864 type:complete len:231 (+) Transcript_84582:1060-1752(+)